VTRRLKKLANFSKSSQNMPKYLHQSTILKYKTSTFNHFKILEIHTTNSFLYCLLAKNVKKLLQKVAQNVVIPLGHFFFNYKKPE